MKTRPRKRRLATEILFIAVPILSVAFFYVGLRVFLSTSTPLVAIVSGSMSPSLEAGDLVLVRGVLPEEIRIGDIIAFDRPDLGQTVHRVVAIQPLANGTLTFRTKGDANDIDDQYTLYSQNIHGILLYRIPYLGYLFLDPIVLIIVITVIVVLIIIWPGERKRVRRKHKVRRTPVD